MKKAKKMTPFGMNKKIEDLEIRLAQLERKMKNYIEYYNNHIEREHR